MNESNTGNNHNSAYRVTRIPLLAKSLKHIPMVKNILAGAILMMLGEICAEEIKHCFLHGQENKANREHNGLTSIQDKDQSYNGFDEICSCWRKNTFSWAFIDPYEVLRLGGIGAFQGTYQHFYYTWLDRRFIGNSVSAIAKKVAMDEVFLGPLSLIFFFFYNGVCDTKTVTGGFGHVQRLFVPAYLADLTFWPLVQTINFGLVPTRYRVPYIAFFMCLWNTYLCVLNFRKEKQ